MECYFCMKTESVSEIKQGNSHRTGQLAVRYECPRCGPIFLTRDAYEDFSSMGLTCKEKGIISICLRNESEKRIPDGSYGEMLRLNDLRRLLDSYSEKDPIEKMDITLLILDQNIKNISDNYLVNHRKDYPLFHCFNPGELVRILEFLHDYRWIGSVGDPFNAAGNLFITPKGYEKLRELKKMTIDSRQCFVAMWFADELMDVYNKAIKPAIEYIEDGELEPRFKSLLISEKEHTNDINDEIISEIRRSRFMVCDLTGYRGGVYWEAGFAYGLGLKVIYTCREDWIITQKLKDKDGRLVNELFDEHDNRIRIKKEGVHFDLEHRNRIKWRSEDLPNFKNSLENRIKAVII